MIARVKMSILSLVLAGVAGFVLCGSASADFGLMPGSVSMVAENHDGTIDDQAGSHPFDLNVRLAFNVGEDGKPEGGEPRDIVTDLPPGLVGNPLAVPRCLRVDFEGFLPKCPDDTQIGVLRATVVGLGEIVGPVYNLQPPPGVAAQIAFSIANFNTLQDASVLTGEGYGVSVGTLNLPTAITAASETIWGVPADSGHDLERGAENVGKKVEIPVPSTAPVLPFLTLPTSCASPQRIRVLADSNLAPGSYVEEAAVSVDGGGNPSALSGCERVPFQPEVAVGLSNKSAESPSGLVFDLALPNHGWLDPGGIAETQPRKVVVKLPGGVTVNPSLAVGVGVCTPAEYAAERIETEPGHGCPESSKIGDVVAHSPIVEEAVEGAVYLAAPYENSFGTLAAVYIVARARDRGVLVKQAGRIDFDQATGQITATFEGLPPLPYSSFEVRLREGARAPLVTPAVCGSYRTEIALTPFSVESDSQATSLLSGFQVEQGVNSASCPSGAVAPFDPSVTAGTLNNAAAGYSPLYLRIERHDGEQEITGFSTHLPAGLSGNLSGVPFCAETAIQRAREQTGAEVLASPACPAASEIGHTVVEAGVGGVLAQTPGRLYLAGPYEGAPFSVVSVTAAKVGPFDLGSVVVRLPLQIDPVSAQVSIPSGPADQIPHIVKGVVIHLRTIRVYVSRNDFTINPTSCQTKSITDVVNGSGADTANPDDDTTSTSSVRFQASDCANLSFKPSFKVSTSGKTSRKNGASLHVKLAYPKAPWGSQTNIRIVKVDLPKQLPSRLTTLQKACTAAQFEVNPAGCPAASRVGLAKAITPILPVPIEGPAYFVSYGGAKFPELVIVLQGYGVTINLHGETFISKAGITSSTFRTVPDQPVTSFELTLPQGQYSALAATGNLCTDKLRMPTLFNGQNGAVVKQSTPIAVTGCPKKKAKHKAKKAQSPRHHAS